MYAPSTRVGLTVGTPLRTVLARRRLEEDVGDLELRAPGEEAPVRNDNVKGTFAFLVIGNGV